MYAISRFVAVACISVVVAASVSFASVDGVFGLKQSSGDPAIAIWVPLDSSDSVAGIAWFNNDSSSPIGSILVTIGDESGPGDLSDAIRVADVESASDLNWSEVYFDVPVGVEGDGLYVVLRMQENSPYEHAGNGGGCGIGYTNTGDNQRSWVTGDGVEWGSASSSAKLAVDVVISQDKGRDRLILGGEAGDAENGVDSETPEMADGLVIAPNPFNPMTTIYYSLSETSRVDISVFDPSGRLVRRYSTMTQDAGHHSVVWDGCDSNGRRVRSGVYYARVRSGSWTHSEAMTLVK